MFALKNILYFGIFCILEFQIEDAQPIYVYFKAFNNLYVFGYCMSPLCKRKVAIVQILWTVRVPDPVELCAYYEYSVMFMGLLAPDIVVAG